MEGRLILLFAVLMVFATPGMADLNISKAGCGNTTLCVAVPDGCDPAANQTCLFASLFASGTMLSIKLSGQTGQSGYIGLGLMLGSEVTGMLFVCSQNSSLNKIYFLNTTQDNSVSTLNNTKAEENGGNGNVSQCSYNISISNTSYSILLGNGTVNMNGLGHFNILLRVGPLNVTNPSANINSTVAPTAVSNGTTTQMTTSMTTPMTTKPTGASTILQPNGVTNASVTANSTAASAVTNVTVTTMTTTTTTTARATTKPTGASSALQSHAFLVLLSVFILSILWKA
ncbi:putative GPI-anchored protein pfl2 [Anabas testudineus]|uniref:putative GPI-anchored protein pfl2 n=1 Tax=Anabas testudineus TaxID=64144 RepID=UPI000E4598C5|nr:putative GPI-anchored protein pfl2 [Anabas testudineus]